jgi:hypothetical protein
MIDDRLIDDQLTVTLYAGCRLELPAGTASSGAIHDSLIFFRPGFATVETKSLIGWLCYMTPEHGSNRLRVSGQPLIFDRFDSSIVAGSL